MNEILRGKLRVLFYEYTKSYDVLVKEYREGMSLDKYGEMLALLITNYALKVEQTTKEEYDL